MHFTKEHGYNLLLYIRLQRICHRFGDAAFVKAQAEQKVISSNEKEEILLLLKNIRKIHTSNTKQQSYSGIIYEVDAITAAVNSIGTTDD